MAKTGYKSTGSSRRRCDGKFEVQLRPWVFRCELEPADWYLPVTAAHLAPQLNQQMINVINGGTDRKNAEQKMAQFVATLNDIMSPTKNLVLGVVDRLLRAVFE